MAAGAKNLRAGKAFVELGINDKIVEGLRAAKKKLMAFGNTVASIGKKMTAVGLFAAAPIVAATKIFSSAGDELDEMAARTGFAAETLSELQLAMKLNSVEAGAFEGAVRRMQKVIVGAAEGNKEATGAIGDLGLKLADIQNLRPEKQFELVADRLSQIAEPGERAVAAMRIFGKTGTALLPMIQDGSKGLKIFADEARRMGLTISTESTKRSAALADSFDKIAMVARRAAIAVGEGLAPAAQRLANRVLTIAIATNKWIQANGPIVVTVAKVVAGVIAAGAAVFVLGKAFTFVGSVLGAAATLWSVTTAAIGAAVSIIAAIASPIGLAITAVAALGVAAAIYSGVAGDAINWLKNKFNELGAKATEIVGAISKALAGGDIRLAAEILWTTLKMAWTRGTNALNSIWVNTKFAFLSVFNEMWFGGLEIAQIAFHGLEVAWIETTSFLSTVWTNALVEILNIADSVFTTITKKIIAIMGMLDDSIDVGAAQQMADDDLASKITANEKMRSDRLAEAERERKSERERTAAINEGTISELERQRVSALDKLQGDKADEVKKDAERLAKLREELAALLNKANEKSGSGDGGDTPPGKKKKKFNLDDLLGGLLSNVGGGERSSIFGSFSAANLRYGMGSFGSSDQNDALQTKYLKRIADKVDNIQTEVE